MARNKAIERTAAKRNATLITPTDLGAAASADICGRHERHCLPTCSRYTSRPRISTGI